MDNNQVLFEQWSCSGNDGSATIVVIQRWSKDPKMVFSAMIVVLQRRCSDNDGRARTVRRLDRWIKQPASPEWGAPSPDTLPPPWTSPMVSPISALITDTHCPFVLMFYRIMNVKMSIVSFLFRKLLNPPGLTPVISSTFILL